MKLMLRKELRLSLHPTAPMFLALSAMLLIPSYPYLVAFFYTGLAVFFICLNGRENQDVFYSMLLPVAKRDIVRARFLTVSLLEAAQLLLGVPFAILRQRLMADPNPVGMDANIALFGLAMMLLGLFNLVFFPVYYRRPERVGMPFVLASLAEAVYVVAAEVCAHQVPFMRRVLDTMDPAYMPWKLAVLGAGAALLGLMTFLACGLAEKRFEQVDL